MNTSSTPVSEKPAAESVFVTSAWSRTVTQPIAIAVTITALFVGIISVASGIAPEHPWFSLGPLFFVIALEGIYTTLWLHHPDRWVLEQTKYRAAEFLFLILVLRLVVWIITKQPLPDLDTISLYLGAPLTFFADRFFLAASFLAYLCWAAAIHIGSIFAQLAISVIEATYYAQPIHERMVWADNKPATLNRGSLVQDFFRWWLWSGILLIICVGLSTIELSTFMSQLNLLAVTHLGLQPALLGAMISYFLAGFWLISQGRLEVLNARWLISGVHKTNIVERRWQRNSLFVLLAVALVAAFLPIGSTLPISRLLNLIVGFFLYIVNLIFFLISLLVGLILSLLAALMPSRKAPTETAEPPPSLQKFIEQPPTPLATDSIASLFFSSLFWAVFIFIAVSAILFYIQERGYQINGRSLQQIWAAIKQWLQMMWLGVNTQVAELRHTVRQRRQRKETADTSPKPPWRFIRVNALSPREQIRYFYLSIVRRASDKGVIRHQSETPLEYIDTLKQNWPEEQTELDQLTQAFLHARYSPQNVEKSQAATIKNTWKRVKATIRKSREP